MKRQCCLTVSKAMTKTSRPNDVRFSFPKVEARAVDELGDPPRRD